MCISYFSVFAILQETVILGVYLFIAISQLVTPVKTTSLTTVPTTTTIMAQSDLVLVANGNADFAKKFYKNISQEEGNVFFSPISAHAVLSMAYQGAGGTTAKGFSTALSVADHKIAANGYSSIMEALSNVTNVTLHIANSIFTMDGFDVKKEFVDAVKKSFKSYTEKVDFAKNVEAAKKINSWVGNITRDKIKDLITSDSLDSSTRLVLVNAVYFKGNWKHQFNKTATLVEPFYINKTDKVDCQMMHITKRFRYQDNEELNAQILELPYTNEDISMVIILPNERDGIKDLETKLQSVDLSNLTNGLYSVEVEVSLPKFKMETTMDLKTILTDMELGVMFNPKEANFSGISDQPLFVSKVIQKAFIEVNEEGAEAAAATAVRVRKFKCLTTPKEKIIFKADHPFIEILQMCQADRHIVLFHGKTVLPIYE